LESDKGLTLYTTEGCHLCEHAEAILDELALPFTAVDIADSDALMERYGVRIPVLATASGRELGWPFDGSAVTAFLAIRV
jgi:hypothetical protein